MTLLINKLGVNATNIVPARQFLSCYNRVVDAVYEVPNTEGYFYKCDTAGTTVKVVGIAYGGETAYITNAAGYVTSIAPYSNGFMVAGFWTYTIPTLGTVFTTHDCATFTEDGVTSGKGYVRSAATFATFPNNTDLGIARLKSRWDGTQYIVYARLTQVGITSDHSTRIGRWNAATSKWELLTTPSLFGCDSYDIEVVGGVTTVYASGYVNNTTAPYSLCRWVSTNPSVWTQCAGGFPMAESYIDGRPVYPAIAIANGNVFVGGAGTGGTLPSNYIVKYNPTTDTWGAAANGLNGIVTDLACVLNGTERTILAVGAFTEDGVSNTLRYMAQLNVANNTWGAVGNNPYTFQMNPVVLDATSAYPKIVNSEPSDTSKFVVGSFLIGAQCPVVPGGTTTNLLEIKNMTFAAPTALSVTARAAGGIQDCTWGIDQWADRYTMTIVGKGTWIDNNPYPTVPYFTSAYLQSKGLVGNTSYVLQVTGGVNTFGGVNEYSGIDEASVVASTSFLSVPSAPTGLSYISASSTLTWVAPVGGAVSYKVYNGITEINATTGTSALASTSANVQSAFTVVAFNGSGKSVASAILYVLPVPAAPTALTKVSSTGTTITLSWGASAGGAVSYNIYENGTTSVGTSTTTSKTITGLIPGSSHSYTVKGVNASGESAASNTLVAVTTLLATPATLATSLISTTGLTLSWGAVAGATFYEIYGAGTTKTSATNSIALTGLTANNSYSLTVKALSSDNYSVVSAAFTGLTLPSAPLNLVKASSTATTMNIQWDTPVGGAGSYKVKVNGVVQVVTVTAV